MDRVIARQSKLIYSSNMSKKTISISSITLKKFLVNSIPMIFQSIIEQNKLLKKSSVSSFDAQTQIAISFPDYVNRLLKHTYVEAGTVIYALMLIDKLCATNKFCLSTKNMHKTFFTALIISIKLLEDTTFEEHHYVKASGLNGKEIAVLEEEFMSLLDYKLKIKDEKFNVYLENCVEACCN